MVPGENKEGYVCERWRVPGSPRRGTRGRNGVWFREFREFRGLAKHIEQWLVEFPQTGRRRLQRLDHPIANRRHCISNCSGPPTTVHITERMRVQFRGEVFNLVNHNYFGRDNFNTDPNNANFRTVFPSLVSNHNGFPRQIQLGLKFL